MMFSSVLLAALTFLTSSTVLGAGLRTNAADVLTAAGHTISTVEWSAKVGPYEIAAFNGTLEELFAFVEFENPGFNSTSLLADEDHVIARDVETRNKNGILCCPIAGQNFNTAVAWAIRDGARYLQRLGGSITIGPAGTVDGNKNCGRISCSYNAAVYLCNDNGFAISPNAGYLSSYVFDLLDNCEDNVGYWGPWLGAKRVCGQEFDTDHYNVFVAADTC